MKEKGHVNTNSDSDHCYHNKDNFTNLHRSSTGLGFDTQELGLIRGCACIVSSPPRGWGGYLSARALFKISFAFSPLPVPATYQQTTAY